MFSAPKNDRTRQFLQSILEPNADVAETRALSGTASTAT
jgi:hypothetical protein